MIEDADRWAPGYAEAGARSVTFHVEAAAAPVRLAARPCAARASRAGMALRRRPRSSRTPTCSASWTCCCVMTVEPGFGGQTFLDLVLPKIRTRPRAGRRAATSTSGSRSTAACRRRDHRAVRRGRRRRVRGRLGGVRRRRPGRGGRRAPRAGGDGDRRPLVGAALAGESAADDAVAACAGSPSTGSSEMSTIGKSVTSRSAGSGEGGPGALRGVQQPDRDERRGVRAEQPDLVEPVAAGQPGDVHARGPGRCRCRRPRRRRCPSGRAVPRAARSRPPGRRCRRCRRRSSRPAPAPSRLRRARSRRPGRRQPRPAADGPAAGEVGDGWRARRPVEPTWSRRPRQRELAVTRSQTRAGGGCRGVGGGEVARGHDRARSVGQLLAALGAGRRHGARAHRPRARRERAARGRPRQRAAASSTSSRWRSRPSDRRMWLLHGAQRQAQLAGDLGVREVVEERQGQDRAGRLARAGTARRPAAPGWSRRRPGDGAVSEPPPGSRRR